jgi:hypothetical protein
MCFAELGFQVMYEKGYQAVVEVLLVAQAAKVFERHASSSFVTDSIDQIILPGVS